MDKNYIKIKHKQNGSGVIDIMKVLSLQHNNKNNTHAKIKVLKDELKNNDEFPKSVKNEFDKVYNVLLELNDPKIIKDMIQSVNDMSHYDAMIANINLVK
jgi:hypothetical protein